MKVFHCGNCSRRVFFENVSCVNCHHQLAFSPDLMEMVAGEPLNNGAGVWRALSSAAGEQRYRLCTNYVQLDVCNWVVPADDAQPLCRACRLTRMIPDLSVPAHFEAWRKLETAKRRLVYSLLALDLSLENRSENPEHGLAFEFLADTPDRDEVLTGHDSGVITINIAEADDAEREKRRISLHEPYRTLLGHLRHEVGHYYWDIVVRENDENSLAAFRKLFGDEREDYNAALKRHYEQGAPADWREQFVSTYASAHPWEDWAETWAHYLHMMDTLETASSSGITIDPRKAPGLFPARQISDRPLREIEFDRLVESWLALTYALNNLSRSLGLPDAYPFVLPLAALAKLRFVHDLVAVPPRPNANSAMTTTAT